MTGKFNKNKYGIYEADHTRFGGLIYPSDFNTDYRGKDNTNGSQIAKRIASDYQFDKQFKKNTENRNRQKEYQKENKIITKRS